MRHTFSGQLTVRCVALAAAVGFGAGSASADLSNSVFHLTAATANGTGDFDVDIGQGSWNNGVYTWQLTTPVTIHDAAGDELGVLLNASATYIGDPSIALFFNFTNGGADSLVIISSALLSFAPLNPAQASATAGVTVTDNSLDGRAFAHGTAGATGTHSYQANLNGLIPAGTQFAELVNNVDVLVPGGSASGSGNTGGLQNVVGAVSSMSSRFQFNATALDGFSGTSNFRVVPEPASLTLLLTGGLFAARRRR